MDTLNADRALDAQIHTLVFGHALQMRWCSQGECGNWEEVQSIYEWRGGTMEVSDYTHLHPCYLPDMHWLVVPLYSTDTAAAIGVLDAFAEAHGCQYRITRRLDGRYACTLTGGRLVYPTPDVAFTADADTLARAVCLALMEARG